MNRSAVIHRASHVIPINKPVIADGAVVTDGDKILACASFSEIRQRYPEAKVVDHPDCALMPPLINAHVHLELSHLAYLGLEKSPSSFTSWVERLIGERVRHPFSGEEIVEQGRVVLRQLYDQGISGLADTGNTIVSSDIGKDFSGKYLFFHEHLGFSAEAADRELKAAANESLQSMCTAHAPYSSNGLLIKGLKDQARKRNGLFSIHVAETRAENQFIREGDGPFRDFLEKVGAWDHSFQPEAIDNCGAIRYLHQLGILDEGTICVHCVHVSDQEIKYIADSGAKVCLCPGSNRFLGVGRAPLARFLAAGILPALGTDSLASNPELSLWREMAILREDNPDVEVQDILTIATLGGARALGLEGVYGTLTRDVSSEMLAIPLPSESCSSQRVLDYLVSGDQNITPFRV